MEMNLSSMLSACLVISEVDSELADLPPPAVADSAVESDSVGFGLLPPAVADPRGKLLSEISECSVPKDLELRILHRVFLRSPAACCLTYQIRQQLLTLIR